MHALYSMLAYVISLGERIPYRFWIPYLQSSPKHINFCQIRNMYGMIVNMKIHDVYR